MEIILELVGEDGSTEKLYLSRFKDVGSDPNEKFLVLRIGNSVHYSVEARLVEKAIAALGYDDR